jgi:hypothetical protein
MTMLMMMMMANADYIYCLFFLLLYCILMWREDEEAWQETKLWSISRTVNLFWFLQECWQDASSSAPITSQPSQASVCLSVSLSHLKRLYPALSVYPFVEILAFTFFLLSLLSLQAKLDSKPAYHPPSGVR